MTATAHCAVCGGSGVDVICTKNGYDHMTCGCGSVFLSPPAPRGAVDPTIESHTPAFYALPAELKLRWLERWVPRGRLLEIGCGDGWFLAAAQRHGFHVAGIEPDAARARRVEARLATTVDCNLLEATTLDDGAFDVVYNCDLLAHFPDPVQAVVRMRRLLAPDGVLFLEVGLIGGFRRFWFRRMPESSAPRHRWYFTAEGLRRLLARGGMRVERMRRFGLAVPALADQLVFGVLRRLRLVRHAEIDARSAILSPTLIDRYANFMRYRVGALLPSFPGPSTAFVVARRQVDA